MANLIPKRKSVWLWSAFGPVALILTFTIAARPSPSESVRSELIRLQKQNGLSLVGVRDNKIYTIAFAKHKLNKPKPLPIEGDLMGGSVSEDGTKIAFDYCREPGLTHPTPERTECSGGLVLATMQFDGSNVREFPYLVNPAYMLCWSHDGSKLALVARDIRKEKYAPLELQILELATGTTQVIGTGREFVDPQCWSPDDKQVVYTANNMAGQGLSAIYDIDKKISRDFSKGTRPTWSPDGNWIALLDCPPSLGCKYFAVRPSGNGRKVLFESESATAHVVPRFPLCRVRKRRWGFRKNTSSAVAGDGSSAGETPGGQFYRLVCGLLRWRHNGVSMGDEERLGKLAPWR